MAVVGGVKAIAAQPSGDVTIYIFAGFVLLVIGVPLTLFGYGGLMKQLRRFKAERPARADSHNTERKWVLGTAARLTRIKVALGLFAIALVGATLIFSTGTLRNMEPTPLMVAAERGYTEVVKALIDSGADVNAQRNNGWSALIHAARHGRTETVRVLMDAGADVNAKSNDGETALMLALQYDHTGVVDILKQSGAK